MAVSIEQGTQFHSTPVGLLGRLHRPCPLLLSMDDERRRNRCIVRASTCQNRCLAFLGILLPFRFPPCSTLRNPSSSLPPPLLPLIDVPISYPTYPRIPPAERVTHLLTMHLGPVGRPLCRFPGRLGLSCPRVPVACLVPGTLVGRPCPVPCYYLDLGRSFYLIVFFIFR